MGSDDDGDYGDMEDEDEEANQVLKDKNVDLDAAAPKPPGLSGELATLRRKARMNASQYSTGNKADRQKMHQVSNRTLPFKLLAKQSRRVLPVSPTSVRRSS